VRTRKIGLLRDGGPADGRFQILSTAVRGRGPEITKALDRELVLVVSFGVCQETSDFLSRYLLLIRCKVYEQAVGLHYAVNCCLHGTLPEVQQRPGTGTLVPAAHSEEMEIRN
jgi:hypothetical protein